MIQVGVIGVGGWGKNLARNYYQNPGANLQYVCDLDAKKLSFIHTQYPGTKTTQRYQDLLEDKTLNAVVIATTAPHHYQLAKEALLAGKDVYVEKPLVMDVAHAEDLIALADKLERILMVGHLLEYHPVVTHMKQLITEKAFGDIYYIYCQRLNLGTVRGDENALWNFAPHDISVILHLLGKEPTDVSARGQCYLQKNIEDVVFLSLNFADQAMAHVHVSWLDPHKSRKITVVGSKKMAVFDDMEASEKLRIYDKGAQFNADYNSYAEYVGLRFGDVVLPYIKNAEPLTIECNHFLESIRERKQPLSDGRDGLRVIKVLDAAQRSLKRNGEPIKL